MALIDQFFDRVIEPLFNPLVDFSYRLPNLLGGTLTGIAFVMVTLLLSPLLLILVLIGKE